MKLNKVFVGLLMIGIIGCKQNSSQKTENIHFTMDVL
jgi:hypothetical protein